MKAYGYYAAVILVQLAYGASSIIIKAALARGMNQFVFVVYRHIISVLVLGPFAYVLLAVLFMMEKVKIKSLRGQAKVLGTVICVCGSLVFTFWKGGYKVKGFTDKPLVNISTESSHGNDRDEDWIKGAALILASNIAWSAWLILQASVTKVYPAKLSLNVLICIIASLQSSVLSIIFVRSPGLWKLDWNFQLLATIYSGTVSSVLVYGLQLWCISNKGPVFASLFSPLQGLVVAIFSSVFLAERLHLSSLLGALLIIVGLYSVLWGKWNDDSAVATAKTQDQLPQVSVTGSQLVNTEKSNEAINMNYREKELLQL